MDLATEPGEQGFKWVFIIHGHGAPNHNRALDQAGDYFRDVYGHMVNLVGLLPVVSAWDGKKTNAERKEDGLVIHAGMDETSMMLSVRPDLVDPRYKTARPQSGEKMEDLINVARSKEWRGYFGSPRLASRTKYQKGWGTAAREAVSVALKILAGMDERQIARFADEMKKSAPDAMLDEASLSHEEATKRKQDEWLKQNDLQ